MLKWPDFCCFDDFIFGNTSWAGEWGLVLEVVANEGAMYEDDDNLVFANDAIDDAVVFGFEYSLAALADSTINIHARCVHLLPISTERCQRVFMSIPTSHDLLSLLYSTYSTQYKSCQLLCEVAF